MIGKQLLKKIIAQTPYRIIGDRGANRFQAMDVSLSGLKSRGFQPDIIIDGGAHLGTFSISTKKIFPDANFHLVEPQTACLISLRKTCAEEGFALYECALSDCDGEICFTGTSEPSTGAHVTDLNSDAHAVPASTLDNLFAHRITQADRTLLKLDLQGYELHALRGGVKLLNSIEVILTEVSFFAQAYEPSIIELLSFLNSNGFELYEVASLSGRTRDNRLHQGDFMFARKGSPLLQDCHWE